MSRSELTEAAVVEAELDQVDAGLRDMVAGHTDYYLRLATRLKLAEDGAEFEPGSDVETRMVFSLAGHALMRGLFAAAIAMDGEEAGEGVSL